ncbi:carbohydrate ABC transporter permease [Candidatus Mycoplasma pogonae]
MIRNWLISFKTKNSNQDLNILSKKIPFWKPFLFLMPFLLVILIFTIIPFGLSLEKSFAPGQDIESVGKDTWGIQAYQAVAEDENFQVSIRNSILYGLISLPITLLIALLISSAIAHVHRKFARGFWQTVFFLPYVTNSIAIATAFLYFFDSSIGIINSITGYETKWLNSGNYNTFNALTVTLAHGIWSHLPFQILLLVTAMLSVDKTLYKAASIDGASNFKQFIRITLPSIKRTLNLLITLAIIGGIKVFPLALFETKPEKAMQNGGATIMIYIYDAIKQGNYSIAGAATIIMFLIGILFSIVLKSAIALTLKFTKWWGEKRVYNKIKNSTKVSKNLFSKKYRKSFI